MANKQNSEEKESDVSLPETDVSAPSQDSDSTTMAICCSSGGVKYISNPVSSTSVLSTVDVTTNTLHMPLSQVSSSPPSDSYMRTTSYQSTGDDPSADIALVGRLSSKVVSESERIELAATNYPPVEEDISVVQEATDTGGSSEMLLPSSILPPVKPTVVTGTKFIDSADADFRDKAQKICDAVSQYYMEQFVDRWKKKTKQESSTITVVASLLVERNNKFNVVVLTAGTRIKYECSYFMKKDNPDESIWGLCDGHAEAVCYRLAGVYLLTELIKLHDMRDSIFEKCNDEGYILKKGIRFHLFTSHPPCGFMAKKERHFLSWKRPFVGKPHSMQCSSTILAGAYLGIQGPLSHLLVKPIYISSVTMPRYKSVETLHNSYIREKFEMFQRQSHLLTEPEQQYFFHPPHIEIVDIDPRKLFRECYKPYIDDDHPNKPPQIPEEVASNRKRNKNKAINHNKIAGTIPDVIQNAGINTLVFTIDNGIGTQEFRDSVLHSRYKLSKLHYDLKEKRFKSLQEARVRLSQALNIKEALGRLGEILTKQIQETCEFRQRKADEITMLLTKSTMQPPETAELAGLYHELKTSLGQVNKDGDLLKIVNALGENVTYQEMLDDLKSLQEQGKKHRDDSEFYLELMGCDWARYMETISDDVNRSIFD